MANSGSNRAFTLDFINVGTPRSGTTWLFECLRGHPELFLPAGKDLFFWGSGYSHSNRGSNFNKGFAWYEAQFASAGPTQKRGEIGTQYLADTDAAHRIHRAFPDIKIIMLLRNPVDRFYSDYFKNRHKYHLPPVDQFIEQKNNSAILSGMYDQMIPRYLDLFPRQQLAWFLFDEITSAPHNLLKKILRFLEIDETYVPALLETTVNSGAAEGAYHAMVQPLLRLSQKKPLVHLKKPLQTSGLPHLVMLLARRYAQKGKHSPAQDKETRERLLKLYLPHIETLEQITGEDLSSWKQTV